MLDLRLVTVSYDAESGAFPQAPLADLRGEIVSVVEHFFFHDGLPRLLLVVQHHPPEERVGARPKGGSPPKADPRRELSPDEAQIYDRLRAWRSGPVRQLSIRDPKPRTISVAPFRDRVAHQALCQAIVADLERYSIHHSYACRRGKGQHRALRQARRFARRAPWAYKGDIRAYFASVPHRRVMESLRRRVRDEAICERIERAVQVPLAGLAEGRGLAVGSLVSQHLANLYLGELDHWITDGLGLGRYLRYMDDRCPPGKCEARGG